MHTHLTDAETEDRIAESICLGSESWPNQVFREIPKLQQGMILLLNTSYKSVVEHACPLPSPKIVAEGHQSHTCPKLCSVLGNSTTFSY